MNWTEEEFNEYLNSHKKAPVSAVKNKTSKLSAKQNKYHADNPTKYGKRWDSKKELAYYENLLLLQKAGEIIEIELQPSFLLQKAFKRNGKTERAIRYNADFKVTYTDGHVEIVDVKASPKFKTDVYRIKRKLLLYKYPHLEFKEVC